jgi:diaminohydroxyphosphoribosylaminopyrimidine deaminase/5-amino-6-(5-phosphoribosylamino)uracil reductase
VSNASADRRWMAAAIALASRGRGLATPNPNVGCVIVSAGHVIGRGWTQPGGRPHAEAMALAEAGEAARGATAYVTLEPCAHEGGRGEPCADSLIAAGIGRVVSATRDPDPRTDGSGLARLRVVGVAVTENILPDEAQAAMAGWWAHAKLGRAHVTLKLATSLDGCIAMADGSSRWITGERARAHAHLLRARNDAILVGRGTWEADAPALDVRLAGLEGRGPRRLVLSGGGRAGLDPGSPATGREADSGPGSSPGRRGVEAVATPRYAAALSGVNDLLVEGGAKTAAAFLAEDLVDTLILYRAPILIGGGKASLSDIGLAALADAHGRWRLGDARQLGKDRVEVYQRT